MTRKHCDCRRTSTSITLNDDNFTLNKYYLFLMVAFLGVLSGSKILLGASALRIGLCKNI